MPENQFANFASTSQSWNDVSITHAKVGANTLWTEQNMDCKTGKRADFEHSSGKAKRLNPCIIVALFCTNMNRMSYLKRHCRR